MFEVLVVPVGNTRVFDEVEASLGHVYARNVVIETSEFIVVNASRAKPSRTFVANAQLF